MISTFREYRPYFDFIIHEQFELHSDIAEEWNASFRNMFHGCEKITCLIYWNDISKIQISVFILDAPVHDNEVHVNRVGIKPITISS